MLPKIWSEHKQYRATFLPQGLSEHMWNLTQIGTSGEGSLHPATVGVEQFGATLHIYGVESGPEFYPISTKGTSTCM